MRIFVFILFSSTLVACDARPTPSSNGHKLTESYECYRCHDGGKKWVSQTTENGCVNCHIEIQTGLQDNDYPKEHLDEWKRNIVSYPRVPALVGTSRFKPDWIANFLQHPTDLRPSLSGMMPRLKITPADAKTIAEFLTGDTSKIPAFTLGDAARGKILFDENGCASCHTVAGSALVPSALPPGVTVVDMGNATRLAPDLRVTRERMTMEATNAWLADPQGFDKDTLMPKFPFTDLERSDLVTYLFEFELLPPEKAIAFKKLPVLKRDVFYPEVEKEVFRDTCWHCHSTPRWFDDADGGPGNVGGFGYAGKGIDLSNWHTINAGGETDGKPIDLFSDVDGLPKLVAHLVARHREIEGEPTKVLGMPLGLQPYSAESIQLVETWIHQGARRAP